MLVICQAGAMLWGDRTVILNGQLVRLETLLRCKSGLELLIALWVPENEQPKITIQK
jgi:hypothetical protein